MVTKVLGHQESVVHREKFPRIRTITKHGKPRYQVDPRPHAKQESFPTLSAAKKRANAIASDYAKLGSEGIDFSTTLRVMALACEQELNPWKKTIADATAYYVDFLREEQSKRQSKTLADCVVEWKTAKHSKKRKILRADTLRDIKQTSKLLTEVFEGKRIREVQRKDIEVYLDSLNVSLQRRENLRNRMGQFFNWCVAEKYAIANPCDGIEYDIEDTDVTIASVAEARRMLAVAEEKYPRLVAYIALGLFAGLRPTEAQLLRWEDISFNNRQISIQKQITKVKSARLIKEIKPNLLEWLRVWGEGKSGPIKSPNFSNELKAFRADAGYAIKGKNATGKRWTQDLLRHSYASYWLPVGQNMHQLAYMMGNSVEIIKKHYENIVPNPMDVKEYWEILPKQVVEKREAEARKLDERNREEAEATSNCGKAIRDEQGTWYPVMDQGVVTTDDLKVLD